MINGTFEATSVVCCLCAPGSSATIVGGWLCVVTLIVGLISCYTWLFMQSQCLLGDLTSLLFVR